MSKECGILSVIGVYLLLNKSNHLFKNFKVSITLKVKMRLYESASAPIFPWQKQTNHRRETHHALHAEETVPPHAQPI